MRADERAPGAALPADGAVALAPGDAGEASRFAADGAVALAPGDAGEAALFADDEAVALAPGDAGLLAGARSLGVLLGSFDPPHRGHAHIARTLLDRADRALLLLPAVHLEKRIVPGVNALLPERLALLRCLAADLGGRVHGGLAREVLYLRLVPALARRFPAARLVLAMGDDSYRRLLASPATYASAGRPFGPAEARALERLAAEVLVFGRHADAPGRIAVPAPLRALSSTEVRRRAAELASARAPVAAWQERLGGLLTPAVLERVRARACYAAG